MNKKIKRAMDEDLEDFIGDTARLGYSVKSQVANQYSVYLTEDFVSPSYYTNVFNMMLDASELDTITFFISSNGGRADGLILLLEGLTVTDAHTQAVIVGDAHSAASIFAMHCDSVHVGDNASMLTHYVSFGAVGKGADVVAKVAHTSKTSEKLIRSAYTGFLTEDEIKDMIKGTEYWFDSEEIITRLQNKAAALAPKTQELELSATMPQVVASVPMKTTTKKSKTKT